MNLNDYIFRMHELENTISETLEPVLSMHNQVLESCLPILEIQNTLTHSIQPIIEFQNIFSNVVDSAQYASTYLNNIMSNLSPALLNLASIQQDIINKLSHLDFYDSLSHMSAESTMQFSQVVDEIISEFNSLNSSNMTELTDASQSLLNTNSQSKHLTWEQVIAIISFILSVISFIQSQIPDTRLDAIESSINTLIEIQMSELNLLTDKTDE